MKPALCKTCVHTDFSRLRISFKVELQVPHLLSFWHAIICPVGAAPSSLREREAGRPEVQWC